MDAFSHCDALVRSRDEDRWLAARYAPPAARRRLMALYAVHLEIERIPSQVREAPLGEIRLQWHRDALAAIAAGKPPPPHPPLLALAEADVGAETMGALGEAIDARARLLYSDPFHSAGDFATWLSASESFLAAGALRLVPGRERVDAAALESAAAAYALARFGRPLANHLYTDITAEARRLFCSARQAAFPAAAMPTLAHLTLTERYLAHPDPGGLGKRLHILRAILRGRI